MHDDVGGKGIGAGIKARLILEHPHSAGKARMLQQQRVAALFQGDVIVIGQPVIAMHDAALGQQQCGQMIADEPGRSGDQNAGGRGVIRAHRYPRSG